MKRGAVAGWPVGPVLVVVALVSLSDLVWLARDTRPPRWDESVHLLAAEHVRQAPPGREWSAAMEETFYPPVVPFVGGLAAAMLGRTDDGYAWSLLFFLALLVTSTAGLATLEFGAGAGLPAAAVAALSPLITRETHGFMLDVPLAALVITALWLAAGGGFRDPVRAGLVGAVCGAAMLTKWTAAVYLVPAFVGLLRRDLRAGAASRSWVGVAIQAGICLMVCLPWYGEHWSTIAGKGWRAAYMDFAVADARLFSPAALLFYVASLGWGAPVASGWLLVAAPRLWRSRDRRWLLGALLVPLVLMGAIRNKNDRYSIPLIPLASVAAVAGVVGPNPRRTSRTIVAGTLAVAALFHVATAFGVPGLGAWDNRPHADRWPLDAILGAVAVGGASSVSLAVIPDHPYLNPSNLIFYATREYPGIEVRGFEGAPGDSRFCLVKTGDPGVGAIQRWVPARRHLTNELLSATQRGRPFVVRHRWPLPDGSEAVLLVRRDRR